MTTTAYVTAAAPVGSGDSTVANVFEFAKASYDAAVATLPPTHGPTARH